MWRISRKDGHTIVLSDVYRDTLVPHVRVELWGCVSQQKGRAPRETTEKACVVMLMERRDRSVCRARGQLEALCMLQPSFYE